MYVYATAVDLIINSSITHSMLFVLPIVVAAILRWARAPGWSVVGGVIAGILLGPTIFGRVAPERYEALFIGGVEERAALVDLSRRHGATLAAAHSQLEPAALRAIEEQQRLERAPFEETLEAVRWTFQRPLRSYASVMVTLALLGAGLLREPHGGGQRTGIFAASSIGIWAAALPAGLACAALVWGWHYSVPLAAVAASAVAIGPWLMKPSDRQAADDAEVNGARRVELAGRISSLAALAGLAFALLAAGQYAALAWSAPLLALPIGWLLRSSGTGGATPTTRITRGVLSWFVIPCLAACATLKVDLIEDVRFGVTVLFLLLSADGRWLGALIGALVPGGRRILTTMRLVIGSMACGPTQLAVVVLMAHTHVLPAELVIALVLGAVLIELSARARRVMADRIAETEEVVEGEE